jgi:DNA-binding MarR family transcriptional regulator
MTKKQSSRVSSGASLPQGELMGRELSNAVVFFHEAIAGHLGISIAEWKCLGLLGQLGSMSASQLAELSGFTTGAITGIVDRLEKAGLVRREAHPTDRRSVIVQPLASQRIREQVEPVFQSLGRAMAALAGKYSADELSAIASFMTGMTEVLRGETAKLKASRAKASS